MEKPKRIMRRQTIRDILPTSIWNHYLKLGREKDIRWVSIDEAYKTCKIRFAKKVEVWTWDRPRGMPWRRDYNKDRWL